jgi:hypothetical protein
LTFVLQETIGIPFDAPAAPATVITGIPGGSDAPWDLSALAAEPNEVVIFENMQHLLVDLPPRGFSAIRPRRAAALPIVQGDELVGCFVVYLNGALPYGPTFKTFLVLLAREMSTSASVVAAYENEIQSQYCGPHSNGLQCSG